MNSGVAEWVRLSCLGQGHCCVNNVAQSLNRVDFSKADPNPNQFMS